MQVTLAKTYYNSKKRPRVPNIVGWWVSEKLDGWRVYTKDGRLYSRNGNLIDAPAEWLASFPKSITLDGELMSYVFVNGRYVPSRNTLASIIRSRGTSKNMWLKIRFHVFDAFVHGDYRKRYDLLSRFHGIGPILRVPQKIITSYDDLKKSFYRVAQRGGEGIMLRDPFAPYIEGRTDRLLKLKVHED